MTIAAYIRVSSKAQDHATQRAAIERMATARGEVIGTWYAEKKSASTMARPELQRLQEDAKAGKIEKLYLFRLDRLTRTGIKDTLTALDDFRGEGIEVVSVADGFDLNGPCAEVIIAVLAWAGKMELLAKNERIAAARERVEAEGGSWGRPSTLTPAQLETLRRMRAEKRTIREISSALGVSKTIIGRACKAAPATA